MVLNWLGYRIGIIIGRYFMALRRQLLGEGEPWPLPEPTAVRPSSASYGLWQTDAAAWAVNRYPILSREEVQMAVKRMSEGGYDV